MHFKTIKLDYNQIKPLTAYAVLRGCGSCLLESAYDDGYGKYSYIGINPCATFSARANCIEIREGKQATVGKQKVISFTADPYSALDDFRGGQRIFGFISYEAVRLKEKLLSRHEASLVPDFFFHNYTSIISFDHRAQLVILTHYGDDNELQQILAKLTNLPETFPSFSEKADVDFTCDTSDTEYINMVEQAKRYLESGDIFQVVLSRTFHAQVNADSFTIYRALREVSPTAYLALFEEEEFAIVSASPELLVGVKDGQIETMPIAGSCKSGDSVERLLNDPKETAEHIMLVDLARNDIGAIAKIGSVKVTEFKQVKHYGHISHIVSRVVGSKADCITNLLVLKSILPAGTLSGAPKIRAMEIIDELEGSRRGLYGGAIVIIDEEGDITSAIAIRTTLITNGVAQIRVGAGIVLDSVGINEAAETRLKAEGLITALRLAEGVVLS
jgi:anthranilate synthase component I